MAIGRQRGAALLAAILVFAVSLLALAPPAQAQRPDRLYGGPKGIVKSNRGDLLEGIMVQLIAQKSAIRTTVYSDADGHYEFPKLEAGAYTLRIARPLEYHPFVKEGVAIGGADKLDDITLARVTTSELLPPFPEIAAQLTGSEWLLSLSGSDPGNALMPLLDQVGCCLKSAALLVSFDPADGEIACVAPDNHERQVACGEFS